MSEQISYREQLLAINAVCGAIVHLSANLALSGELFSTIAKSSNDVTSKEVAVIHRNGLQDTLRKINATMQDLADYFSECGAEDYVDELAVNHASELAGIVLNEDQSNP